MARVCVRASSAASATDAPTVYVVLLPALSPVSGAVSVSPVNVNDGVTQVPLAGPVTGTANPPPVTVTFNDPSDAAVSAIGEPERVPKMRQQIRSLLDVAGMKNLTVSLYVHLGIGGYDEF